MGQSLATPLSQWHMGMHPHAKGMRISSIGRVSLELGEALRVEMADTSPDAGDLVHVQYYIATDVGPWALWLSCARRDVDDCEASLRELAPPFAEEASA